MELEGNLLLNMLPNSDIPLGGTDTGEVVTKTFSNSVRGAYLSPEGAGLDEACWEGPIPPKSTLEDLLKLGKWAEPGEEEEEELRPVGRGRAGKTAPPVGEGTPGVAGPKLRLSKLGKEGLRWPVFVGGAP